MPKSKVSKSRLSPIAQIGRVSPKSSVVTLVLFGQTKDRTGIAFSHDSLPSVSARETLRKRWRERLEMVADALSEK